MAFGKQLLTVLEDGIFHTDTLLYSIKLSKRMGCSMSVLMLSSFDEDPGDNQTLNESLVNVICEYIRAEGIRVSCGVKQGDKASQFLKYLASLNSVAAIVWGGDIDIVTGRRRKLGEHWFAKVRSHVQYPIVTPKTRGKRKNNKNI